MLYCTESFGSFVQLCEHLFRKLNMLLSDINIFKKMFKFYLDPDASKTYKYFSVLVEENCTVSFLLSCSIHIDLLAVLGCTTNHNQYKPHDEIFIFHYIKHFFGVVTAPSRTNLNYIN